MLPYTDTKPVGAADFYFAINATFQFIRRRLGVVSLRAYWVDLGREYFTPVSQIWKDRGLAGVAAYWRSFFAAEPCGDVEILESGDRVEVFVRSCPAIEHLRKGGREICPEFCEHCFFVSDAIGRSAGIEVRVEGGNGSCHQSFAHAGAMSSRQCLEQITRCS